MATAEEIRRSSSSIPPLRNRLRLSNSPCTSSACASFKMRTCNTPRYCDVRQLARRQLLAPTGVRKRLARPAADRRPRWRAARRVDHRRVDAGRARELRALIVCTGRPTALVRARHVPARRTGTRRRLRPQPNEGRDGPGAASCTASSGARGPAKHLLASFLAQSHQPLHHALRLPQPSPQSSSIGRRHRRRRCRCRCLRRCRTNSLRSVVVVTLSNCCTNASGRRRCGRTSSAWCAAAACPCRP